MDDPLARAQTALESGDIAEGARMTGIIANGSANYIAALGKEAEAATRDLHALMDRAATPKERSSLRAQIKAVREELERKEAAALRSLF